MLLENKVAIITGAAGGIGEATVKEFIKEGAKVVLSGRTLSKLQALADSLNLDDSRALVVQADISKEADVKRLFEEALKKFGALDIVYNNAGYEGVISRFADYPVDVFDQVVNINLRGTFLCMKYALNTLKEGGVIINCSSIGGVKAMPNTAAYNATKWAINGMTRTAALEYAPKGIRVNAVCPSPVDTRMIHSIEQGESGGVRSIEEVQQAFFNVIPMGRYAEPEEIAQSVVFLASDKARFITGVCLSTDGGMSA